MLNLISSYYLHKTIFEILKSIQNQNYGDIPLSQHKKYLHEIKLITNP